MVYINTEDGRAERGILWGCLGTREIRGRQTLQTDSRINSAVLVA
jgi:hypothetical protein